MPIDLTGVFPLILAVLTALIALIKYIMENMEKKAIVEFYDPLKVEDKPKPDVPKRSYLMSDATKAWLICGETPADQTTLLNQVAAAEAQGLVKYTVRWSTGWQDIEYGLMGGGGRG
jgi:hypothetical protein